MRHRVFVTEAIQHAIFEHLENTRFASHAERRDTFFAQMMNMGGIVEEFVEGEHKRSPSGQMRTIPAANWKPRPPTTSQWRSRRSNVYGLSFSGRPSLSTSDPERHHARWTGSCKEDVIGRAAVDFVRRT